MIRLVIIAELLIADVVDSFVRYHLRTEFSKIISFTNSFIQSNLAFVLLDGKPFSIRFWEKPNSMIMLVFTTQGTKPDGGYSFFPIKLFDAILY